MADNLIEGRVAQILNERELVLNVGTRDGVAEGMVFAVLSESPLEVRDPISNEFLDEVDREKVRVEVVEARDRIAICRTYEVRVVGGFLDPGFSRLLEPRREVVATLRSDDYPNPLPPRESYVKIGDRARQVRESLSELHSA